MIILLTKIDLMVFLISFCIMPLSIGFLLTGYLHIFNRFFFVYGWYKCFRGYAKYFEEIKMNVERGMMIRIMCD